MNRKNQRRLAFVLALILMFTFVPGALAASFSAVVQSDRMTVYGDSDLFEQLGSLEKDTVVTVLSYDDGVAKIRYRGYTGYAEVSDMVTVDSISTTAVVAMDTRVYASASTTAKSVKVNKGEQVNVLSMSDNWARIERAGNVAYIKSSALTQQDVPTASPAPTANLGSDDNGVVQCDITATVSSRTLTVYASASTRSKKLGTMKQGTVVTVHAYSKKWAYIELNGKYGYCQHSGLTKGGSIVETPTPEPTATPTPEPTATPKPIDYTDSKYSNEEIVFAFLTRELKLNTAAACGVMANIKAESSFNPKALNSIGCYGICQWYAGRRTRLNNFCSQNGYDSSTLVGQLWYLKYELENYYAGTLNYIREVDNTAEGAYDAGYYWCYYFEVPENRASNSAKRGSIAQTTFWPKYSK